MPLKRLRQQTASVIVRCKRTKKLVVFLLTSITVVFDRQSFDSALVCIKA